MAGGTDGDGNDNSARSGPDKAEAGTADSPSRAQAHIILDKDGKPCRACNSFTSFAAHSKAALKDAGQTVRPPPDCPADVETLGRSTWTLLHTMSATYPESPTQSQQSDLAAFVRLFARLYPCWFCAGDFQTYIDRVSPTVGSRSDFGNWLCEAHNDVNQKLGKPRFDCAKWEERWRTGPKDGRCG